MNRKSAFEALFALIVLALFGGTLSLGTGACVGAPKSKQQFEQMDEGDFQDWLTRVTLYCEIAANQVVRKHPERTEKLKDYADVLVTLASSQDPLGDAAQMVGLDEPIVFIVVLEGKALLNARGGLPGGTRTMELLHAIATGVRSGVQPVAATTKSSP